MIAEGPSTLRELASYAIENLAARQAAEAKAERLADVLRKMYDEYMRDECCDYVVINRLIERGHALSSEGE